MTTERVRLREVALDAAIRIDADTRPPSRECLNERTEEILEAADLIAAWLTAPPPAVSITLTAGPITNRTPGATAPPSPQGDIMALELGDNQQVTITATPKDSVGEPTTDTITWAVDNTTAVQALQVSADTLSCTLLGAVPATGVTLTASDTQGNSAPFVFDVLSGPATSIGLSAGPVTAQTPPAPAPSA